MDKDDQFLIVFLDTFLRTHGYMITDDRKAILLHGLEVQNQANGRDEALDWLAKELEHDF